MCSCDSVTEQMTFPFWALFRISRVADWKAKNMNDGAGSFAARIFGSGELLEPGL
jgi:hypothetical protein